MRPKYILVAGVCGSGRREFLAGIAGRTGLRLAFCQPALAVFVNEDCRCLAIEERGCVVGTLFHRHGPAQPISSLSRADCAAIVSGGGDMLPRRFWGGYVGAVAGPQSVKVLRDPSGAFPCYFSRGPGWVAFAPDAEILVRSGLANIEFDWRELARQFLSGGVPTPATGIKGMSELLPGFSMRFPGHSDAQLPCWSPWDHVSEQPGNADETAERLSRTVRNCVSGWASGRGRLLVSVSGGLDSSIVAACLAGAGADVVCLTMFGEDPSGDERPFARVLCDHLGLPVIERPYRLDDIDITEPLGAHLPRPKDRSQALAYERAHLDVARDIGADAFVTGNGGDSVFGYSQSAAAIADRYLSEGVGRDLLGTLLDVCRQTGCSFLDAAAGAWRIACRPRAYRCRADPLFLSPDLLAVIGGTQTGHPWLEAPRGALPGKAAHIAMILRVQQSFEPSRSSHLAVLNPLISQPIMEACLAVPSWDWRCGGRDRSLARKAFARDLPARILARRVKGGPSHFATELLDRFRGSIRERLLGGRLARERILDVVALEQALRSGHSCTNEERVRILEFTAAEAWLDSWASRAALAPAREDVRGRPLDRFRV